ncbi:MAG: PDZ domain-containing protein [Synergistaceae bacterium]|jgi:PIN domain nuclease of toxin-antitoxin system|nr:PDZ domain-containing protein [Synergistaceae bacterium]MCK9437834.1 PDZ domain-containing protein [Synergistaceae bacterium]MDD2350786.1 PDZ domain-containing protein [Synergistaceae bacterium]MDD3319084.1 PDZ domain-containing protein [Synergistaceae bacterium]MDD3672344.1 PDZ domain-containing protein [Synergistaceae bacterium]
MKKYIRFTALFLILLIAPVRTAYAYTEHHSYSSSHTEVWVDATGLAALLVTLAAGNSNNDAEAAKQQAAYEQKVREIREHSKESSRKEMEHALDIIFERGVPGAVELLVRSWEGEGKKTFLDDRNGVAVLKVSGFEENIRLEYTIRQENKKISVRITAPDYSISEESSAYYKEPVPIPPSKSYLGFELEEFMRDPQGRLLIKDVVKGTAVFYAGVLPGDTLVMIDTYDTKNFDIARVDSYLQNRAEAKAKVKITVSQKGEKKTIEIQL